MNRICMITQEFAGINKSGGIGACVRGLALHLATLGHRVDVLITDLHVPSYFQKDEALSCLQIHRLSDIAASDEQADPPDDEITKSHCVYRFLKNGNYDVLHFHDWLGAGFYAAQAKRQGLLSSIIVTHLHGSAEWVRRHSLSIPSIEDYEVEALERSQIENSDIVISPSQYLLDWYRDAGVKLPKSKVLNWILPQWIEQKPPIGPLTAHHIEPGAIDEIIFFGRHERRKGFEIFVDAISALPKSFQPAITFLGRFDILDREFTGSYVLRKLAHYGGAIEFINDMGQRDAINLLHCSGKALCVMPSLVENSPCVVGECFSIGKAFITCDVGGISELIAPSSRDLCLIQPDAKELSKAILRVADMGMPQLESQLFPEQIVDAWTAMHREIAKSQKKTSKIRKNKSPLVSVCFTHHERPALLDQALKHILAQTYENLEIIIVDDGSKTAAAQAYLTHLEATKHRFPLQVIRSENRYLGAARNLAASHAKGEYVLFHDDDNLATPHEVETFVSAALHCNADILTALPYMFTTQAQVDSGTKPKLKYFPIGIGGTFSFFKNLFGDANALVRKSAFEKIGGFTELYGVGWEDWEFFLRAYLKDCHLAVVPDPLFYYRTNADGMLATGNPLKNVERLFQSVNEFGPKTSEEIYRYAMGVQLKKVILDQTKNKLGLEKENDLHHELMEIEPNSSEAQIKLSDLAFALGRFDDALRIGMKYREQREKLSVLMSAVRARSPSRPRSIATHIVHPTDRREILYMNGWIASKANGPLHFDRLLVDDQFYELLQVIRYPRVDVSAYLNIKSEVDLGFQAFARPSNQSTPVIEDVTAPLYNIPLAKMESVANIQLPIAEDNPLGYVESLQWLRFYQMGEIDSDRTCSIEVETSAPSQTAIMWLPGVLDIGERLSATRARFSKPVGFINATAPKLILPSEARSDITVTQAF